MVQRQEIEDPRDRILLAAEKLFASRGFDATSVQEITDMASVNKAMLYYYFGNKLSLFRELLKLGLESVKHAIDEAVKQATVEQKLRVFLNTYFEVVASHPELAQIVYREILGYGSQSIPDTRDELALHIGRIHEIIEEGQRLGELKPLDPALTAYSFLGMSNIFITAHLIGSRPLDIPTIVDHNLQLFLHGAAAG